MASTTFINIAVKELPVTWYSKHQYTVLTSLPKNHVKTDKEWNGVDEVIKRGLSTHSHVQLGLVSAATGLY